MWKILFLSTVILTEGRYRDNPSAAQFYGTYKLAYAWPKVTRNIPNCSETTYFKVNASLDLPITCKCERESPNFALILQEIPVLKQILLVDIVKSFDELQQALNDKCQCSPLDKNRDIFLKIDDNYFLQYDKENITRTYLLSKKIPKADEITKVIDGLPDLKDKDGSMMCSE